MSEEISNREYRQRVIKDLISQLHAGKSVNDVKEKFASAFAHVSAEEISQAEKALIADGMPISEIQKLCDVHASVFSDSIEDIHSISEWDLPGHPAAVLKQENRALESLIGEIYLVLNSLSDNNINSLEEYLEKLKHIDCHYLKKENLFFPYMEKYGITAPPKVMWGVDDEIRTQIKDILIELKSFNLLKIRQIAEDLLNKISGMIVKEENIMLPMLLENLTQDEWKQIADESNEFGYFLIENVPVWTPVHESEDKTGNGDMIRPDVFSFPTGLLKLEEIILLLDTLPVDITFVDKDDTVKYFSQGAERIFPRTKTIIGRKVSDCHPPASVHIVDKIISDFKNGTKNHEDFWINMDDKFILIRYFAMRNASGEYMGTVEVTQNIKPIRDLTGEKRLISE